MARDYDLKNICSMFKADLQAVLIAAENGECQKIKRRVEGMLKSIQKIEDHAKNSKPRGMPNCVIV